MERFRVLITSVGKKVPLVKAVYQALEHFGGGDVIGGDCNPKCLASYFVDDFWKMPPLESLALTELIDTCKKLKVNVIIPTRNGELAFFAKHFFKLMDRGIYVMVSPPESLEIALDKLKFYQSLKEWALPTIPTSENIDEIQSDLFVVKERFGAGSLNIGLALSKQAALEKAKELKQPLFQPFIKDEELSVDLYLDRQHRVHGVICRERNLVEGGESQVSTTRFDPKIELLCKSAAEKMKLKGHVLFQTLGPYLLECNPRVGGASTLSFKAGLQSLLWCLMESTGQSLPPFMTPSSPIRLIRYPEDWIQ